MKKFIALYGAGSRGKSTTLKMVYKFLDASFELLPEKNVRPDEWGTYLLKDRYDIRVIFAVNGVRVGLESQGDPNSRLEESLQFFCDNKCRLIVCPTRTWGSTVDCVKKLENDFQVEWIKKTFSDDEQGQESCNKADAKKIIKLIKSFVSI